MDRNTQITLLVNCEERVRSYVTNWLRNSAVHDALHRRPPIEPTGDNSDQPKERVRRTG
jgi:hypothetical protein